MHRLPYVMYIFSTWAYLIALPIDAQQFKWPSEIITQKNSNRIIQQHGITARTQESLAISGIASSSSMNSHRQEIPKIIHHTYRTRPNATGFDKVYFNVSYFSFKKFFPEWEYEYLFHVDSDFERCITEEFPDFLKEFRTLERIEKTDAGRYCMLWKFGGIYADLDYEVMRPFYSLLAPGKVTLNESPYEENADSAVQVQNALMAAPRRHPFWLHVFRQMSKVGEHTWNSTCGTGPKMISAVASQHQDQIYPLPCRHFQRLGSCGDPADFAEVYAVHWNVNSYAELQGVPNIWNRQSVSWDHFHPQLDFPWVPPALAQDSFLGPLGSASMQHSLVVVVTNIFMTLCFSTGKLLVLA